MQLSAGLIEKSIILYLEEFGEIENICVSFRFKDETVAESVLRTRFHKIENRIWTTESPNQPFAKKIKLMQPTHILDLSDKVLMNIFKQLDLVDLAHVSETCVHLDRIAKKVFQLKHKIGDLTDEFVSILPRFGDLVTELKPLSYEDKYELDTVVKYCKNLKTLELVSMRLNTDELHSIFMDLSKLKTIIFNGVTVFGANHLSMTINPCVEELFLRDCFIDVALFVKMMPNLRTLSVCDCYNLTKEETMQLCRLKYLKYLEVLYTSIAVQALFDGMVSGGVKIEVVKLSPWSWIPEPIDNIIDAITKLKTIKYLHLSEKFEEILEDKHLVRLAKGLPLLSKLEIGSIGMTINGLKDIVRFAKRLTSMKLRPNISKENIFTLVAIGAADYKAILETIKRRPEKLKLTIRLPREVDVSQIDANARKLDSEWLEVR